jgi:hypothetical protein
VNRARDFDIIVTITPPLTVLVTFLGLVLLIALVLKPRRSPGYLGRVLQRMFSLRLGCSIAFFGVLIVTVVGALLGGVVATIGVVVVALFWALILLSDKVVLYCPGCKKRVNPNETVCSRCGRKLKVPF